MKVYYDVLSQESDLVHARVSFDCKFSGFDCVLLAQAFIDVAESITLIENFEEDDDNATNTFDSKAKVISELSGIFRSDRITVVGRVEDFTGDLRLDFTRSNYIDVTHSSLDRDTIVSLVTSLNSIANSYKFVHLVCNNLSSLDTMSDDEKLSLKLLLRKCVVDKSVLDLVRG